MERKTEILLMGERIQKIKRLKKIRIHREGTNELTISMLLLIGIGLVLWHVIDNPIPFWAFIIIFGTAWALALNFYRCPIRYFNGDTEKLVVAPADGKIVVIEETEEHEYFHDKRLMISIFMSPLNVHANWFPVDGKVKFVHHWFLKSHLHLFQEILELISSWWLAKDLRIKTLQMQWLLMHLKQWRRVLYRRAHGIHQTGFACRCLSATGF